MKFSLSLTLAAIGLLALLAAPAAASDPPGGDTVTVTTEFVYAPPEKEPESKARALALFGAKYRTAATGAKFLARKGLLTHFADRQREILCLAADRIDAMKTACALDNQEACEDLQGLSLSARPQAY